MTSREKSFIKKSLREFSKREIEAIRRLPAYDFELSDNYSGNMNALLARMRILEHAIGIRKKILLIAAIIAILVTAAGCCVVGTRIIRDYENGRATQFYTDGVGEKDEFEELYMPSIPEEYEVYASNDYWCSRSRVWVCGEKKIVFEHNLMTNSSTLLDTEYEDYEILNVDDRQVYYINRKGMHVAFWYYDGYAFSLSTRRGITYDEFYALLESVDIVSEDNTNPKKH